MVPTEELRSPLPSAIIDLRNVPLAEMQALGSDVLGRAIGRVLPGSSVPSAAVAAFQSSI